MSASAARPILVFDGDCGFCTSSAGFGRRLLGVEHVEPWQFLDLDELGLTPEQCDTVGGVGYRSQQAPSPIGGRATPSCGTWKRVSCS